MTATRESSPHLLAPSNRHNPPAPPCQGGMTTGSILKSPSLLPSFRPSLLPSSPPSLLPSSPPFVIPVKTGIHPSIHPRIPPSVYIPAPPCQEKMDSRFRGNDRRRGRMTTGSTLPPDKGGLGGGLKGERVFQPVDLASLPIQPPPCPVNHHRHGAQVCTGTRSPTGCPMCQTSPSVIPAKAGLHPVANRVSDVPYFSFRHSRGSGNPSRRKAE